MLKTTSAAGYQTRSDSPKSAQTVQRLPVLALGMGLALFFVVTFVLCVLFDLWFPALAMNPVWSPLLPGFTWISWSSFLLGLLETFAYGWYIALIFGPLYNFFAARFDATARS